MIEKKLYSQNMVLKNTEIQFLFLKEYEDFFQSERAKILMEEILEPFARLQEFAHETGIAPMRKTLFIGEAPFTIGFFFKEKTWAFFSPRLHREVLLLQNHPGEWRDLRDIVEKVKTIPLTAQMTEIEFLTQAYAMDGLPNLFDQGRFSKINEKTEELFHKIVSEVSKAKPSFMEWGTNLALSLFAKYPRLRNHLLKIIALLPSMSSPKQAPELKKLLVEAFVHILNPLNLPDSPPLPFWMRPFFSFVKSLISIFPAPLLLWILQLKIQFFGKRFVAGKDIKSAWGSLNFLHKTGREATLDQLGELVLAESEAEEYTENVCKIIRNYASFFHGRELGRAGIPRNEVSIKVSAMAPFLEAHAYQRAYQQIAPRLKKILLCARQHGAFVNIDAEHYPYRDLVFDIYAQVLRETKELASFEDTGIVIQCYLKDAYFHFREVLNLAKERALRMPIRLVKGAYFDSETKEAFETASNAPQFLNKEESDLCFRQMIILTLENSEHLQLRVASHNFSEHAFAEVVRDEMFPKAPIIEHQCLHMTCEPLSYALAQMGWAQRDYVPVGNLLVGMGYLVRRILENSSQVGFLTLLRDQKALKQLKTPQFLHNEKIQGRKIERDFGEKIVDIKYYETTPIPFYKKIMWKSYEEETSKLFSLQKNPPRPFHLCLDDFLAMKASVLLNRFKLAKIISEDFSLLPKDALSEVDDFATELLKISMRYIHHSVPDIKNLPPVLLIIDHSTFFYKTMSYAFEEALHGHLVYLSFFRNNKRQKVGRWFEALNSLFALEDIIKEIDPEYVNDWISSGKFSKVIDLTSRKSSLMNIVCASPNVDNGHLLSQTLPSFLKHGGFHERSPSLLFVHEHKSEALRTRIKDIFQAFISGMGLASDLSSLYPILSQDMLLSFVQHVEDWKAKGLEDMEILVDLTHLIRKNEVLVGPMVVHLQNWEILLKKPGLLQRIWGPLLIITTYKDEKALQNWLSNLKSVKEVSYFTESESSKQLLREKIRNYPLNLE